MKMTHINWFQWSSPQALYPFAGKLIPWFAVLSVVCFLLYPVADEKYAHVPRVMGVVYAVLSLLFLLDWASRATASRSRK